MQTDLSIISRRLKEAMTTLPYKAGVIMVNFSKERFRYQNWLDEYPQKWPRRSRKKPWSNKGKVPNNKGRALLVKTGALRRSIRIISTTNNSVTIGSNLPYAAAHNEGGRMRFTQNVRAHVRLNSRRDLTGIVSAKEGKNSTKIKWGKSATGISQVRAHKRSYDYKMPRRRFMGESQYLMNQISRMIAAEINKTFRP